VKFKTNKRQLTIVAVVVVAGAALLAGRSARDPQQDGTDDAARRACGIFSQGRFEAQTKTERLALADKVTANSGWSKNKTIATRAAEMGRSAGGTDAAWKASATSLTTACRDAGALT
jgi:hypothetical protein